MPFRFQTGRSAQTELHPERPRILGIEPRLPPHYIEAAHNQWRTEGHNVGFYNRGQANKPQRKPRLSEVSPLAYT